MNVTAGEEKMITLQSRRGSERELEKKNYFDGLRPSRDNLVTFFFLDRIPTHPDSTLLP